MIDKLEPIDFWRLSDSFTVVQATLLILGIDPADEQEHVLNTNVQNRPTGFDAIFSAITQAINNKTLKAKNRYSTQQIDYGYVMDTNADDRQEILAFFDTEITTKSVIYKTTPDWQLTTVNVDDLKQWLLSRNFKPAFFFSEEENSDPDYMNQNHARYSPKLAAAIKVWQAMDDENLRAGKSIITSMENWLKSRYKELKLENNGTVNKSAISECAKIANWNLKGGAPTTPTKE